MNPGIRQFSRWKSKRSDEAWRLNRVNVTSNILLFWFSLFSTPAEISPRKSVLLRSKLKSRMKLHKHHSDGSLKSIGREKRRSMDSLGSINGESVSKRYSDYSLRSFNGDCVSIPIDQYEQLLKAQQVSEINKSSCSLATLPGCFLFLLLLREVFVFFPSP